MEVEELKDFSQATHTAIISDLHLCEEEPVNLRFPLWKKYKTRQFFFDEDFKNFLRHLVYKSGGEKVELILNGDIFDFDSVTRKPERPVFRLTWLEKRRGLHPQEEKSRFKIRVILDDHKIWIEALRQFVLDGHRVIFVIGNHDMELHWPSVQQEIMSALDVPGELQSNVRFNEWFYISNGDTLVEHGNQYDPYCLAQDPVNPYVQRFNRVEVRLPFGNLATRYMINGMGFFNPHVDSNFIMSLPEYVKFFFRYMLLAQPLIIVTWFWGASVVLFQSFFDRLRPSFSDPLSVEEKVEHVAAKANATPRMVRQLKELAVAPAASYPTIVARELWLDRAFLLLIGFFVIFQFFLFIKTMFDLSFFWTFIPLFLLIPFFLFYFKSVHSDVTEAKEPKERILSQASIITKVPRVVYGHTHQVCHENIGAVEHLNSGTWSPAFLDVECEKPLEQKTFVWICPNDKGSRDARVYQFKEDREHEVFGASSQKHSLQKLLS